jgi:metal-responsive CopG/Arc/MetJ family transcriptional regulator
MTDRVTIRISQELSEALDRFIEAEVVPVRSRQDAFRHIVTTWLASEGYAPSAAIERGDKPSREVRGS